MRLIAFVLAGLAPFLAILGLATFAIQITHNWVLLREPLHLMEICGFLVGDTPVPEIICFCLIYMGAKEGMDYADSI